MAEKQNECKAILFDLDETLLDRNQAIEQLFLIILDQCYESVSEVMKPKMLNSFKEYDKKSYGQFNKGKVLASFFDAFPPKYRMPDTDMLDFWNSHFPQCFSINQKTLDLINTIKTDVKVAIITNGATNRQKAKIARTDLGSCFDEIVISEAAGYSKPDRRIFEYALSRLQVQAEDALYVGDDLVKDIDGSQKASMRGIWFNPKKDKNGTDIKPYAEIDSLSQLLDYID